MFDEKKFPIILCTDCVLWLWRTLNGTLDVSCTAYVIYGNVSIGDWSVDWPFCIVIGRLIESLTYYFQDANIV